MQKYPLTDRLREIFKQHAINSPELEAKLKEVYNIKHEEFQQGTEMPVVENQEQILLKKFYPSLDKTKRA